jgi:hypothetical protein
MKKAEFKAGIDSGEDSWLGKRSSQRELDEACGGAICGCGGCKGDTHVSSGDSIEDRDVDGKKRWMFSSISMGSTI